MTNRWLRRASLALVGRGCITRGRRLVALVLLAVAWSAAPAVAQVVATPYLHANFGDTEFRRGGAGLTLGHHGRRIGFELDVDFHSHFFKDAELEAIPNPCRPGAVGTCIDSNTEALILSGNVIVPVPVWTKTSLRPYGSAGLGLIHAWIHDAGEYDSSQTNLAFNAGGGALYWLKDWLALRADVRWLHAFVDENKREGGYYHDYDFVRVSIGVTFALPR